MEEAEKNYYKLKKLIREKTEEKNVNLPEKGACSGNCELRHYKIKVDEALADDLNTPKVLATLWTMLKDDSISPGKKKTLIEKIDFVFSLGLLDFSDIQEEELVIPEEIIKLAEQRKKFKQEKDFTSADEVRKKIQDL